MCVFSISPPFHATNGLLPSRRARVHRLGSLNFTPPLGPCVWSNPSFIALVLGGLCPGSCRTWAGHTLTYSPRSLPRLAEKSHKTGQHVPLQIVLPKPKCVPPKVQHSLDFTIFAPLGSPQVWDTSSPADTPLSHWQALDAAATASPPPRSSPHAWLPPTHSHFPHNELPLASLLWLHQQSVSRQVVLFSFLESMLCPSRHKNPLGQGETTTISFATEFLKSIISVHCAS